MADSGYREVLELFEADEPTPQFVAGLRLRLGDEVAASRPTGKDGGDVVVIEPSPGIDRSGRRRRELRMIGLAAAAVVVVVLGAVALIARDGGDTEVDTDVIDQPPQLDIDSPDTVPVGPDETTDAQGWDFDVTVIEVEAGDAVAASDRFAWVAAKDGVTLSEIDLASNTVVRTIEIPLSAGVAAYGFGSVWVGHGDGTVSRIDPAAGVVDATLDVGGAPLWIEAGVDSVWVGNGGGGDAVRIDPASNTVVARVALGAVAGVVMQNRHGVFVRDLDGVVTRIDPTTNDVVARIDTPESGITLAVSPDSVWAPGGRAGVVYRIDPATNLVDGEIEIAARSGGETNVFGIHFVGGSVWVRYSSGCDDDTTCRQWVARIDPDSGTVVASVELPADWGTSGVSVGPDTAWSWSADAVARFDF